MYIVTLKHECKYGADLVSSELNCSIMDIGSGPNYGFAM